MGKRLCNLPLKHQEHKIILLYGRSISNNEDQRHFYLTGRTGLYPCYPEGATTRLILTESVIDAASLLQQAEISTEYEVLALYGIRWLQAQGKSKRSVSSVLWVLRHYFNYLTVEGRRTDNPAAGIFIKGLTRKLPSDLLSAGQMQQLYDQYNIQLHVDLGKKIMLGLLIYQGLTTDEIERLQAADIRLKEGKIFIHGTSRSNERWLKLEAEQVVDLQRYLAVNRFKAGALLARQKKGLISANNIINQG